MAYGRKVAGDNEYTTPEVGIVENVSMDGQFVLSDDNSYATITYFQQNGSKVERRFYDSDDEKDQETTDRCIKHICTKIVSTETYEKTFATPATSFVDFINKVNKLIAGKTASSKFRVIFHYNNKGYVVVARYPNFMEKMNVNPSKLVLSSYVKGFMTKPESPRADNEDAEMHHAEAGVSDDLSF